MIRWLHISDLHLGSEGMTTSMLRDELPVFLKKEGLKCDYVFCTGDIKTAGRGDCGFSNEMADYICKICDAVEVDTQMLFIVPGNHDINREITERKSAIEKVIFFKTREDYCQTCCRSMKFAYGWLGMNTIMWYNVFNTSTKCRPENYAVRTKPMRHS